MKNKVSEKTQRNILIVTHNLLNPFHASKKSFFALGALANCLKEKGLKVDAQNDLALQIHAKCVVSPVDLTLASNIILTSLTSFQEV